MSQQGEGTHTTSESSEAESTAHRSRTISILIINPNSTASMTAALKPLLTDLLHPRLSLDFYTAPPSAPPSIDDAATSALSRTGDLPHTAPVPHTTESRWAGYTGSRTSRVLGVPGCVLFPASTHHPHTHA
ncbi:hypothetical protein NM688_g6607 [Phlebia brevispora]|uniref:Uncharacterized protein n=1 Tax=Phlebia brevispora TaxID=194682 RepID=A0ACC1SE44_9APHY|nr:hypothetical protein NM688_g6607 [Phlebia brevispora]